MAELTAKEKSVLTDRQQEIQKRVKEGDKAPAIAKALGISENAVYQQQRNIRKALGQGSPTGAKQASGRKNAGRKSVDKKRTPAAAAAAPATTPAAVYKPPTLLQLAKQELKDSEAAIREQANVITEAERTIERAKAKTTELEADRDRKADLLAVLQGEKRAVAIPKPKEQPVEAPTPAADAAGGPGSRVERNAAKSAKGSSAKAGGSNGADKAPSGSQDGTSGAAATPKPGSQAERESTADDVDAPASAPATA